jgi:protein-disulfide isomerase
MVMHKTLVSITLSILVIFIFGALVFNKVHRIDLPPAVQIDIADQPTLGQGKIMVVAFEDMKCSNCKAYDQVIYPFIKSHYIDTGKVSYTLIPLAFIQNSMPAGNAALCVYHQKPALFFEYVDYLYQHQPDEALDWATAETLTEFAQHVPGIDIPALSECIQNNTYYTQLQQNLGVAGKVMGETVQTPSLYINGHLVSPMTIEQIEKVVQTLKVN